MYTIHVLLFGGLQFCTVISCIKSILPIGMILGKTKEKSNWKDIYRLIADLDEKKNLRHSTVVLYEDTNQLVNQFVIFYIDFACAVVLEHRINM